MANWRGYNLSKEGSSESALAESFFFKIFFDVDIFKVFIEFVTILLLFYVWGVFLATGHMGS